MSNAPGIIIYYQEDKLSVEETASLQTFYELDNVIFEHDLKQQLPSGTLAILKLDDDPLVLHEQDASIRIMHINQAFEEITKHVLNTVLRSEPEQDSYRQRLEQFIQQQEGEIFTLDQILIQLGINKSNDDADYAVSSIIRALVELGCIKENLLIFTPPQSSIEQQHKKQRFVEPFEIVT